MLACVAVTLDLILGEPRRYHPLVGFGWLANKLEAWFNPSNSQNKTTQRFIGSVALVLLLSPFVLAAYWICNISDANDAISIFANTLLLYFAIGHKSLHDHANAVTSALQANNHEGAQLAASYMVSRDSAAIEPVPATIESVLENGNDGVFGALFWFFIASGAGALAFRLVNTMDAMWGYKTPRYFYFGWAAARLDDVISYVPARLTALTYALLGQTKLAITCWRHQAPLWDSPNAGPVMSAGAGALDIKLGGAACYQGEWHLRPTLGTQNQPNVTDIARALKLVRYGVYSWLIVFMLIEVVRHA